MGFRRRCDGLENWMHGDEDQDIVIDTEHASREVDPEEDGVVPASGEAVVSVDQCLMCEEGRTTCRQKKPQ